MIFKSTTGQDVHVALVSGHTAIVPTTGVELDPIFHKQAIVLGCLPDGAATPVPQVPGNGYDPKKVVRDALILMFKAKDPADFNLNGTAKLSRLNEKTGLQISRTEFDALVIELTKADLL